MDRPHARKRRIYERNQEGRRDGARESHAPHKHPSIDGAGALAVNELGEFGYDLRPPQIKGVLSPRHPVRLAAILGPKDRLDSELGDHCGGLRGKEGRS